MKRFHEELSVMKRQARIDARYTTRRLSLGRFRKRHALDCGNPGCRICHADKIDEQPTRAGVIADLRFKEGLYEISPEAVEQRRNDTYYDVYYSDLEYMEDIFCNDYFEEPLMFS